MVKIYVLIDPITDIVMYVGRTKARMYTRLAMHRHCAKHNNTPRDIWIKNILNNNLKIKFRIIEDCDDEIWRERETYWIDYYRKLNPNLTNISNGGGGSTGCKRTEEAIRTLVEIHSKPVYQIDFNYNILREFPSCKKAGDFLGKRDAPINKAAKSKGYRTSYGFLWIYKTDYSDWSTIKRNYPHSKNYEYLEKRVAQYDLNSNLINIWKSVVEASETLKFRMQSIARAARKERITYKKYIWRYIE